MTKYAAMIRGIGPGNPNMRGQRLAEAFVACGFTNVRPFLGSGNVLFESQLTDIAKLEKIAEAALPRLLDFERSVFIRSAADLQNIVEARPFGELQHQNSGQTYLTVTFFKIPPRDLPKLPYQPDGKPFELVTTVNGALCCVVYHDEGPTTELMVWLDRKFHKQTTTRTWSTLTRMLAKLEN